MGLDSDSSRGGWEDNLGLRVKGFAGQVRGLGVSLEAVRKLQKHLWEDQVDYRRVHEEPLEVGRSS